MFSSVQFSSEDGGMGGGIFFLSFLSSILDPPF